MDDRGVMLYKGQIICPISISNCENITFKRQISKVWGCLFMVISLIGI